MRRIALLLLAAGCAKQVDMDNLKQNLRDGLREQMGLAVTGVQCPPSHAAKVGTEFDCTVSFEAGASAVAQVVVKTDRGKVQWTVTRMSKLLPVASVEQRIAEKLGEQVRVNCGPRFRVAAAGTTFDCQVQAGTVASLARVQMTDDQGGVSWELLEGAKPSLTP